ncbi:DUF6382 domain-containing protein [Clostridium chrysemydis]|uniref:DUF6382 domain-containing protein n=1 Tax=Clostridium chrysemydis TaxID=2665504 RepID=UPI001883898A|nr:DUF6382 domain-containing protein [Clostridium chrysemydis]
MELISLEKNNNFKKYLELPIDNLNLLDYQLEMINQNSSIRAANIEKVIFNETLLLNYDVSGLINLEEYFIKNRTTKAKLLKILIDIGDIITKSNEYFLNSDNFLLNEKQIFLSLEDLKVTMIYIPVEESINDDINKSFRELLKKIVIDLAVLDDMDLKDNFMQIILNQSKMQEITIRKFLKTLQDIKEENFINKREEVSKVSKRGSNLNRTSNSTPKVNIIQNEVSRNNINIKNSTENHNQLDKNINNIQRISEKPIENRSISRVDTANVSKGSNNIKNKINQSQETEEEALIKEIYKPSRKIGAALIQFIFIPIIILALLIDGMDLTKKIVGAVMLVVLDVLVLRILLDKDKKIKVKVSKGKLKADGSSKGKKVKAKKEKTSKRKNKKNKGEDIEINETSSPSVNLSKKEIISQLAYDTEVLDNDTPYLLLSNGGVAEKIYINKDIYKIGRLSSQCDYTLNSKAIGKVHAQIIKNNSQYYIEDLDSKNGSFINSVKIESNQLVELSVDDNITLANINMTFKID